MLNLNKHTKTKPKPKLIFKNCSYGCAYHCVQLLYTTQHRIILIIFTLIFQTIIIAQMMSMGGEGANKQEQHYQQHTSLSLNYNNLSISVTIRDQKKLEMWANARDGRPADYRWRPLFNAAKFGLRPLLDAVQ